MNESVLDSIRARRTVKFTDEDVTDEQSETLASELPKCCPERQSAELANHAKRDRIELFSEF